MSRAAVVIDWPAVDRLKDAHGIKTDAELARRIGVSGPYYSQVKHGIRGVQLPLVVGFLRGLDVPFNFQPGSIYKLSHTPRNFNRKDN